MIYILSMIITLSLILGGIFVAMAPSVSKIQRQDFLRKAQTNAQIAGLQMGDIIGRAYPSTIQNRTLTKDVLVINGIAKTKITTKISVRNNRINVTTSAEQ